MRILFKALKNILSIKMGKKIDYQKLKELNEQNALRAYKYWALPRL